MHARADLAVRDDPGPRRRARVPRCSGTPSSTGRSRAARRSTCGCRRPSSDRWSCRTTGAPTSGTCTSRTSCPPRGRPSSTPQVPPGGTVVVVGLGPIGQMSARIAAHRGAGRVIGLDLVPERLAMARRHGIDVIDVTEVDDLSAAVRDLTDGRGADATIDAVGHGGARVARGGGRPEARRTAARRPRAARHREGRDRPARGAADGDPARAAGRHRVDLRRLRRCGRPDADDGAVRPAADAADGPGERPSVGRRHPAARFSGR